MKPIGDMRDKGVIGTLPLAVERLRGPRLALMLGVEG
jgi:hypothetical protein